MLKQKNTKDELHKEYKTLRNQLIRLRKINYQEIFCKTFWQGIKAIVNIKSKHYNSPTSVEVF